MWQELLGELRDHPCSVIFCFDMYDTYMRCQVGGVEDPRGVGVLEVEHSSNGGIRRKFG